ncbi:hypothetical protein CGLO_06391 [Colletotrichum gloeosporioides Cg-14]|uniref:Uncharacterized protein n=1 Tax=Colletotrichum gloeosporioides (strain Cg-14) TaxID=1237896 RepID=T0KP95_COLGC|nr:hypothetical protein CGLO_06391 [Colletotrichum gloeosporioides Cg-14]
MAVDVQYLVPTADPSLFFLRRVSEPPLAALRCLPLRPRQYSISTITSTSTTSTTKAQFPEPVHICFRPGKPPEAFKEEPPTKHSTLIPHGNLLWTSIVVSATLTSSISTIPWTHRGT